MTSDALQTSITHHANHHRIDDPILRDLKRLQRREGKSLGRLVSDLLAQSLAAQRAQQPVPTTFRWVSQAMAPQIDLRDKDALFDALDGPQP